MPNGEVSPPSSETTRKPNGNSRPSGVLRDYIAVARGSDLVVIRVVGKGSMITAPALAEFTDQQRKSGFRRFVFDLERCRGLDSTFMGVMVGVQTAMRGDSARLLPQFSVTVTAENAAPPAPQPPTEAGLEPMSPAEAVAALQKLISRPNPPGMDLPSGNPAIPAPGPGEAMVTAVNVPPDIAELLAMLGVDKFVKVRGTFDLRQLETTILPEKILPPTEQHRLILQAHEHLVEIDKRNEARFGSFLKSLSQALGSEK
jgi:hypothetical protein